MRLQIFQEDYTDEPGDINRKIVWMLNSGIFKFIFKPVHSEIIEAKPGSFIPGHYHKTMHEMIYVYKGSIVIHYNDPESDDRGSLTMVEGERVFVPAGIAHEIFHVNSSVVIRLTDKSYEHATKDTTQYKI